ncbi:MAG: hypothetical protein NC097_07220 [Clostridium sp.]|nr:hypothetical protein [Prevotella sp.]MCM1429567.1 hypothetical protein [Clostridium sp.]MCM1476026.1 hypothetical protein [Muribaculaceae bacterium]
MTATPKILLMADYSNFHHTLAVGLRRLGCDVTVVSDGTTFMETQRDIDISRRPGKLGGLRLYYSLNFSLRKYLRGYDIVSLRNPIFLEMKPSRVRQIFRNLRSDNPNIFLTALTTDGPFLDMLEAPDSPLRYSEWFVEGKPTRMMDANREEWENWHSPQMHALEQDVYSSIDGAVSALYEYHKALQRVLPAEKIAYGGIPVDLQNMKYQELPVDGKIRLFLGRDRNRILLKGTDILETAARKVIERHSDSAELVLIENVSRRKFYETLENCHIMLDQINSYTPATGALEAMAMGKTVISGAEPEFYDFIGENELRPVINAPLDFDSLCDVIEQAVVNRNLLIQNARRGREFVERHNGVEVVARRFLDFWLARLDSKEYKIPDRQ